MVPSFLDLKAGPDVVTLEKPEGDGFNLQVRKLHKERTD
jgi:hypothetical protein